MQFRTKIIKNKLRNNLQSRQIIPLRYIIFVILLRSVFMAFIVSVMFAVTTFSFRIKTHQGNISTSDQRCSNVVDQLRNNIYATLKIKQNRTSNFQRGTTLILRQRSMLNQCRKIIAQRWYNIASRLFQRSINFC